MKKHLIDFKHPPWHQKGFTLLELILVLVVIVLAVYFLFNVLGSNKKKDQAINQPGEISQGNGENPQTKELYKPKYKCLTPSNSQLIPLKVYTASPQNIYLYNEPKLSALTGSQLGFFKMFFVYDKKDGFYQIGHDPFSGNTLGWMLGSDVFEWSTREALELECKQNTNPKYIWEKEEDIGKDNWKYKQRTDIDEIFRFPIMAAKGNHFKIALTWQTQTWDQKGVAMGWTSEIKTPDEAKIVCYLTRKELEERMTKLLAALKDLKNKPISDHPILKLFKEDLGITFGNGLDLENASIGFYKRVAEEAPEVPSVFRKLPTEIRNEYQRMMETFDRMRRFYENSSNWNERGGGWIPIELIPGN